MYLRGSNGAYRAAETTSGFLYHHDGWMVPWLGHNSMDAIVNIDIPDPSDIIEFERHCDQCEGGMETCTTCWNLARKKKPGCERCSGKGKHICLRCGGTRMLLTTAGERLLDFLKRHGERT